MEVLISTTLIDSVISHDEFVLINNLLKEYNEMKEEIKNVKTYRPSDLAYIAKVSNQTRQFIKDFSLFILCYHIIV